MLKFMLTIGFFRQFLTSIFFNLPLSRTKKTGPCITTSIIFSLILLSMHIYKVFKIKELLEIVLGVFGFNGYSILYTIFPKEVKRLFSVQIFQKT